MALGSLGADATIQGRNGVTPVLMAAQHAHLEVVKALASVARALVSLDADVTFVARTGSGRNETASLISIRMTKVTGRRRTALSLATVMGHANVAAIFAAV
jgi:ankyrin repeat protein